MNHFSQMAQTWDTPQTIKRNEIFAKALEKYLPTKKEGLSLLDFGCGTGLLSLAFVDMAEKLVGVDNTAEMIEKFDERFQGHSQTKSFVLNLESSHDVLGDQEFDFIYTAMTFHHLYDPSNVLSLLKKHLNIGGKIVVIDLDKEDGSFHSDNQSMGVKHYGFSKEKLESWAKYLGFTSFDHEIIHYIEKNERTYGVALAAFGL